MKKTLGQYKAKAIEKIIDLWQRVDVEEIKEDTRKTGLVLLGGGYIGAILGADTITFFEGLTMFITGLVLWLFGIYKRGD